MGTHLSEKEMANDALVGGGMCGRTWTNAATFAHDRGRTWANIRLRTWANVGERCHVEVLRGVGERRTCRRRNAAAAETHSSKTHIRNVKQRLFLIRWPLTPFWCIRE